MTDSDTQTETWKPIPGFRWYEASDHGQIRSIDRKVGTRQLKGTVLKPQPNNSGYLLVKLTDDQGVKQTRTVHRLVLLAFVGPCPAGMETRHLDDDPLNNRWAPVTPPGNLMYGPKWAQEDDKYRNGRPRPPRYEPRPCIRCGNPVNKGGRRCHACVVELGEQAAELLRAGVRLDEVTTRLGYSKPADMHVLAVKYGGWGWLPSPSVTPARSVRVTVRDRLRRLLGRRR